MKIVFVFTGILILFSSCFDKDQVSSPQQSAGKVNSLSVIISDQLWSGETGDSLRKKFAAPVDGLPQEEPLFTINQFPMRALDGTVISRNLIVVKRDDKTEYRFVRNEFAQPQNVVHITGKNVDEILALLESNADQIVRNFKQTEIASTQKNIDTALLDDSILRRKFNISLHIPQSYKYALTKRNFVWLKKEILSGNTNIVIYRVPFKAILKNDEVVSNILRTRDSVGGMFIKGKVRNSRMVTEESYAPYFMPTFLDGRRAYETKGTWELKNDFMSGPFINYAIMDRKTREFIIIEGFCYAPSADKRDLMHELESVIKSVKFIK